jgi:hypothetical protein
VFIAVRFNKHWCKISEDYNCAETCSSRVIVKYIIYRIVRLLVLMELCISNHHARDEQYGGSTDNFSPKLTM